MGTSHSINTITKEEFTAALDQLVDYASLNELISLYDSAAAFEDLQNDLKTPLIVCLRMHVEKGEVALFADILESKDLSEEARVGLETALEIGLTFCSEKGRIDNLLDLSAREDLPRKVRSKIEDSLEIASKCASDNMSVAGIAAAYENELLPENLKEVLEAEFKKSISKAAKEGEISSLAKVYVMDSVPESIKQSILPAFGEGIKMCEEKQDIRKILHTLAHPELPYEVVSLGIDALGELGEIHELMRIVRVQSNFCDVPEAYISQAVSEIWGIKHKLDDEAPFSKNDRANACIIISGIHTLLTRGKSQGLYDKLDDALNSLEDAYELFEDPSFSDGAEDKANALLDSTIESLFDSECQDPPPERWENLESAMIRAAEICAKNHELEEIAELYPLEMWFSESTETKINEILLGAIKLSAERGRPLDIMALLKLGDPTEAEEASEEPKLIPTIENLPLGIKEELVPALESSIEVCAKRTQADDGLEINSAHKRRQELKLGELLGVSERNMAECLLDTVVSPPDDELLEDAISALESHTLPPKLKTALDTMLREAAEIGYTEPFQLMPPMEENRAAGDLRDLLNLGIPDKLRNRLMRILSPPNPVETVKAYIKQLRDERCLPSSGAIHKPAKSKKEGSPMQKAAAKAT